MPICKQNKINKLTYCSKEKIPVNKPGYCSTYIIIFITEEPDQFRRNTIFYWYSCWNKLTSYIISLIKVIKFRTAQKVLFSNNYNITIFSFTLRYRAANEKNWRLSKQSRRYFSLLQMRSFEYFMHNEMVFLKRMISDCNLIEIRIPKKFLVSFYILISFQGLSKVFWKFKIWPPGAFQWIFWYDGLCQIKCR